MTQKEMKKLSRKRMLEMLAEQTGRANRLLRENERLKERIAEREQQLVRLGELAETVLNSNSSPYGEPTPADESTAKASSGSPDPQGDIPRDGQTDPDAVGATKADAGTTPTGSIGSNIVSTANSLATIGKAVVLLIAKKTGKDP